MNLSSASEIEVALRRVGDLLEARGRQYQIVVIGGAAVNLLGFVSRATTDVDILAFARIDAAGRHRLRPPDEPLPTPLVEAARTVGEDLGLAPEWLNTGPAGQWKTGLPPGLEGRVQWRAYGGLQVGVVDRYDLIYFKLYAAADDRGPTSVHFRDLIALHPTAEELDAAGRWVRQQDPSPSFAEVLSQVINHARTLTDRTR